MPLILKNIFNLNILMPSSKCLRKLDILDRQDLVLYPKDAYIQNKEICP